MTALQDDVFTPRQKAVLDFIDLPFCILSIIGSALIVSHIWRSKRHKKIKTTVYHRFLACLSVFDIISSVTMFVSPFLPGAEVAGSAACTVTGYLRVYAVIAAALYNASLSIYFLLIVRYNVTENFLAKYFEPVNHVVNVIGLGILFTVGLPLDVYNPIGFNRGCWAVSYPPGCDGNDCERGGSIGWIYDAMILWGCAIVFGIVVIANLLIYWTVRQTEKRVRRLDASPRDERAWRKSRRVAFQSLLFCLAYVVIFSVSAILQLIPIENVEHRWYYVMLVISNITFPLQGFFDSIIYFRSRYQNWRGICPTWWTAFFLTIWSTESPRAASIASQQISNINSSVNGRTSSHVIGGRGSSSRDISRGDGSETNEDKTETNEDETETNGGAIERKMEPLQTIHSQKELEPATNVQSF